jgi:hypothetical protein
VRKPGAEAWQTAAVKVCVLGVLAIAYAAPALCGTVLTRAVLRRVVLASLCVCVLFWLLDTCCR